MATSSPVRRRAMAPAERAVPSRVATAVAEFDLARGDGEHGSRSPPRRRPPRPRHRRHVPNGWRRAGGGRLNPPIETEPARNRPRMTKGQTFVGATILYKDQFRRSSTTPTTTTWKSAGTTSTASLDGDAFNEGLDGFTSHVERAQRSCISSTPSNSPCRWRRWTWLAPTPTSFLATTLRASNDSLSSCPLACQHRRRARRRRTSRLPHRLLRRPCSAKQWPRSWSRDDHHDHPTHTPRRRRSVPPEPDVASRHRKPDSLVGNSVAAPVHQPARGFPDVRDR